jgi:hypothetical protein
VPRSTTFFFVLLGTCGFLPGAPPEHPYQYPSKTFRRALYYNRRGCALEYLSAAFFFFFFFSFLVPLRCLRRVASINVCFNQGNTDIFLCRVASINVRYNTDILPPPLFASMYINVITESYSISIAVSCVSPRRPFPCASYPSINSRS